MLVLGLRGLMVHDPVPGVVLTFLALALEAGSDLQGSCYPIVEVRPLKNVLALLILELHCHVAFILGDET